MTKRILVVLVATIILLLGSMGCQKAPAVIDGEALYQQMNDLGQFPEMVRRGGNDVYDYYGIDPAQCRQLVNYAAADGLMTDEFLFVESNDPAYAEEVESLLQEQRGEHAGAFDELSREGAVVDPPDSAGRAAGLKNREVDVFAFRNREAFFRAAPEFPVAAHAGLVHDHAVHDFAGNPRNRRCREPGSARVRRSRKRGSAY